MKEDKITGRQEEHGTGEEAREDPSQEPEGSGGLVLRNPAYRFFLAMILGSIALSIPAVHAVFERVTDWLALLTLSIEYSFLNHLGADVGLDGTSLSFHQFYVEIVEECTGIYEMMIYSAAVLTFPTSWRNIAIGLVTGIPLLYFINLFRIVVLLMVGHYHKNLFDFMHIYFWQVTLIVMILSVWSLWANLVVAKMRTE